MVQWYYLEVAHAHANSVPGFQYYIMIFCMYPSADMGWQLLTVTVAAIANIVTIAVAPVCFPGTSKG